MVNMKLNIPNVRLADWAVSKALAVTGEKLVLDEFSESRDPYGKPWAPIQHRSGMPLIDTGIMRQSTRGYVTYMGAQIRIDQEYASFHQTGTKFMPARKLVPDAGPSPIWEAEFKDVLEALADSGEMVK